MTARVLKLVTSIAKKTQRSNLARMNKQNEKGQNFQKTKEKQENQKTTKKKVRYETKANN